MMSDTTIKVCVGNYGSYTAGHLIDQWFELPMAPDVLEGRLKAMQAEAERLVGSPCEEFYISDYDGYPLDGGWESWSDLFNEHTPIESLNLMAAQLATMEDHEIEAATAYIGYQGSRTSMDEAMNVLLQADEVPYYDYDWPEYTGSDPVHQAIHDSITAEEKYGYLVVDNNPELKKLLDSDSAIDSAFDREAYGRLCAELDGVHLMENGYLANESVDMACFDHDAILEEVVSKLNSTNNHLAESFQNAIDQKMSNRVLDELTAGHAFYNPSEQRLVSSIQEGLGRRFIEAEEVAPVEVAAAFAAGADIGQRVWDECESGARDGSTILLLESDNSLRSAIAEIGVGGSETGWFHADEQAVIENVLPRYMNNPGTTDNPSATAPAAKPKRSGLPGPDRAAKHANPAADQKAMTAAAKAQSAPTLKPNAKVVS